MQDIHNEHLSCMLDGELTESHVPDFIEKIQTDPALQKKLDRYGLIRSAIRGEQLVPTDHDLCDRVRAALHGEPTILAPRSLPWKNFRLAGSAMAASLAALAVILVNLTSSPELTPSQPALAQTTTPPVAQVQSTPREILAATVPRAAVLPEKIDTAAVVALEDQSDPNFDAYLLNHNDNVSMMQMPGMMPNVRLVSYGDQ